MALPGFPVDSVPKNHDLSNVPDFEGDPPTVNYEKKVLPGLDPEYTYCAIPN